MPRKIDWDSQIGRRLRLRDLHVFHAVAQHQSMAKAATHLGVSQPAVSEVIADLEHAAACEEQLVQSGVPREKVLRLGLRD